METTTRKWNTTLLINQVIVLAFCFGFRYLPPFGEITEFGMGILGIFLGAIFGWITIGFTWTSITATVAIGLSGAFDSMLACFNAVYGSDTAVVLMTTLFVCAFFEEIELTDIVVGKLLNSGAAKKNSLMLVIIFFLAHWIVSMIVGCIISIVLFVQLYRSMAKQADIKPGHMMNSFFLAGFALLGSFGDVALPFKPTTLAMLNVYTAFTGTTISMGKYLIFVTGAQLLFILLYVLIGRFILRLDFRSLNSVYVENIEVNKKQIVGLLCIVLLMAGYMMTSTNIVIFKYLGMGGVSLVAMSVMIFIQIDGSPLFELEKVVGKFNWGIYFMCTFFLSLAPYLGRADVGITTTISSIMSPLLATVPPVAFLGITVVLCVIFTNILNNFPVAIIFITILFAMQDVLPGVNMAVATITIMLSAFAACATPAASPINAYVFGLTDLISQKNQLICGTLACILFTAFFIFIYYPLISMVF